MVALTIVLGKLLIAALKLSGRNGSSLPGLVAEKLYPRLLSKQLDKLNQGVVVVTGTNGKTTTTKSLVFLLEQSGLRVLTNPTGSNFTRGVYATIIKNSKFWGAMEYDVAVLELDEAYSRIFAKNYPPRIVLALNVMRDQLDRYGEIDTTASMIGETVSYATEGAVLNYNDERVRALANGTEKGVSYFAVADELRAQLPTDDELHMDISTHPSKKKKKKAYKQPKDTVVLSDYRPGNAAFKIDGKYYRSHLKVAGIHNAFNLSAALAVALRVAPHMEPQFIVPTMKDIPAAFGRGEVIAVGDTSITLALVKNPSGFRQSLVSYGTDSYDAAAVVINDDYADSRDVSWLWDVPFESMSAPNLYTAGTRGSDMALRLKYDEKPAKVVESIEKLVERLTEQGVERAIVFCTYTAMLKVREILANKTKVEGMWS